MSINESIIMTITNVYGQ